MVLKQYTPSEDIYIHIYNEEIIQTRLCEVVHTLYRQRKKK